MPDHQLVGTLGVFGRSFLPVLQLLHVVGEGRSAATNAALAWRAGLEGGLPLHRGHQRRTAPEVVLLLRQHVPDQHRQLARGSYRRDLMATFAADAQEEGSEGGPGAFAAAQAASTNMVRAWMIHPY